MKDGALKACVGIGAGLGAYGIYMGAHCASGVPPPDGPIFLGMLAYFGSMVGVVVLGKKLH
jgi:hypothetical protein